MDEKTIKEVLDFLLNSYRARLAVQCESNGGGEECPFDFTTFLNTWKSSGSSWAELRETMVTSIEPLIDEGLFDSILPYLTSSLNQTSRYALCDSSTKEGDNNATSIRESLLSPFNNSSITLADGGSIASSTKAANKGQREITGRKSRERRQLENKGVTEGCEIIIHVCDESKGIREDFRCLQGLLVREMGYFSRVAVRGQRLKDMDISVHCDISIFDWLMKWVKSQPGDKSPPKLEASNVIGLMVSADFLQMSSLTAECLQYTFDNMTQVIKTSPNLGCLNESLTSRLAAKFTNVELEEKIFSVDRGDRITSRLYTQFILSLNDFTEPDMSRGHYASTSTLFQCDTCHQLLINDVAFKIPCTTMKFDCRGRIYSCHVKDPNWSLTNHIKELKRELKTWRRVYWRLWATVHFFYCSRCLMYFAAKDLTTCRYHTHDGSPRSSVPTSATNNTTRDTVRHSRLHHRDQSPVSLIRSSRQISSAKEIEDEESETTEILPYGNYTCCNVSSYKFDTLPPNNGCKLRDHIVDAEDDSNINTMMTLRELIVNKPTKGRVLSQWIDWNNLIEVNGVDKIHASTAGSNTNLDATGLSSCCCCTTTDGRLSPMPNDSDNATTSCNSESETNDDNDDDDENDNGSTTRFPNRRKRDNNYSPCYSTNSHSPNHQYCKKLSSESWSWNPEMSTRYNQDMQREKEEKLMVDLCILLSQRISLDSSVGYQNLKLGYLSRKSHSKNVGGSYLKLEQAWREEIQGSRRPAKSSTKPQ